MYHKKLVMDLQSQYKKNNDRLDNLADMRLDKELTADEYARQKSRIEADQYSITNELTKLTRVKSDQHTRAEKLFIYTKQLPKIWEVSNTEEKNKLLKYILFEPLQDGREYALELKKPFNLIYKKQQKANWCTILESLRTPHWDDSLFDTVEFSNYYHQYEPTL